MEFSDRFLRFRRWSSSKNFRYLDDLIHSGKKEITLNSDIVFDDEGYDEGIPVDVNDLIIDGNGHSIDARTKRNIFRIDGKNVTIKNLTFKNGCAVMGGALSVSPDSSCCIENSCFSENNSYIGGAILNKGNLMLTDSRFSDNSSKEIAGAIHNKGKLTVCGCSFSNNSSKQHGGAIFNYDELTIRNGELSKNAVENSGGALYNFDGTIIIDNARFEDNRADEEYSRDICNESLMKLLDLDFTGPDKTILNNGKILAFKGLENKIHNNAELILMDDIENCFSLLDQLIRKADGELKLNRDIVLNALGEEEDYREGILIDEDIIIDGCGHTIDAQNKTRIFKITGKNVILKNLTLKNGFSEKGSAAAICNDASCVLEKCNVIENESEYGGAVYVRDGELTILDSTFRNNLAYRGAGLTNYKGRVTIRNTLFCKNRSYEHFGYAGAINNGYGEIEIYDSKLTENRAAADGGAITNYKGKLTIKNTSITKNRTQYYYGGAIHNYIGATATLTDCRLSENSSGKKGGAIFNNKYGKLTIEGTAFKNNSSTCAGDIYNVSRGLVTINSAEFEDNQDMGNAATSASENSDGKTIFNKGLMDVDENLKGKIHNEGNFISGPKENEKNFGYLNQLIEDSAGEVKLEHDIKFDLDNEKGKYPEGIPLKYRDFVIDGNGHTIDAQGQSRFFKAIGISFTLRNVTLRNGRDSEGGAIYLQDGECLIEKSSFHSNISEYGGAVYGRNTELTVKDCEFRENLADRDGGVIYNEDSRGNEIHIFDCEFIGNAANRNGGAVYNDYYGGNIVIHDCLFRDNVSRGNGGAIYNWRFSFNKVCIFDCEFINNSSGEFGGAIDNWGGEVELNNSLFENNSSKNGGAISSTSHLSVNSCTFKNNSAQTAGAICSGGHHYRNSFHYGTVKCSDVLFDSNRADEDCTHDIFNREAGLYLKSIRFGDNSKTILNMHNLYFQDENRELEEKIHNSGNLAYPLKENERGFDYLNQMISNSDGSEIKLDHDIKCDAINGERDDYSRGIILDIDDLVIDGNGHSIDAHGVTGIFEISGRNITIKNVTLENGGNSDCSIIISKDASCIIENSCIQHIKDVAVCNSGVLTIDNCRFKNNLSTCVINLGNGDFTVKSTTFENNSVKDSRIRVGNFASRGLIPINSSMWSTFVETGNLIGNGGSASISDSEFLNNDSDSNIIHNNDFLSVESVNFYSNDSKKIIFNDMDSILTVSRGKIADNEVEESSISNRGKSCSVIKTTFEDNGPGRESASSMHNETELTITDCRLKTNARTILNEGRTIYYPQELINAIHNNGTVKLGCRVQDRYDFTKLAETISDCENNEVILNHDFSFEEYEISFFEGGIELDADNLVIDGQNHVIDAKNLSRIFIVTGKNITLKNIHFKNGQSYKDRSISRNVSRNSSGGAIRVYPNVNLILDGCGFENNMSEHYSGAIDNWGDLTVEDCIFTQNSSAENGGAIYNRAKLLVNNCDFTGNVVPMDGGAIMNVGKLTVYESQFRRNGAYNGGAIFNDDELRVEHAEFSQNEISSYGRGGAIHNGSELFVKCSKFLENTGHGFGYGGAISNSDTLTLTDSEFERNRAFYGGAIMNYHFCVSSIKNSTFISNHARHKGGAIDNWEGELIMEGNSLMANSAKYGSAIWPDTSKY